MRAEIVIYLDFDGVMDTGNYCNILHSNDLPMKDEYGTVFDPNRAAYLRYIIEKTCAGIVVSSLWKLFMSFMDLDDMWKARHLLGQIIGFTPLMYSPSQEDGFVGWLEKHLKVKSYVIFDNMPLDRFKDEQDKHFVQVEPNIGIIKKDAGRAIEILKTEII